jgi:hypothetical protein
MRISVTGKGGTTMAEENKPEAPKPRKVIQKPLNPLAMKPGQMYGKVDFAPEKPYKDILEKK